MKILMKKMVGRKGAGLAKGGIGEWS